MTLGEERLKFNANPSADVHTIISEIRQKSAELIDLCETLKSKDARLASLAQTSYEQACMWAIKCVTR
jgi:hypothetical protein